MEIIILLIRKLMFREVEGVAQTHTGRGRGVGHSCNPHFQSLTLMLFLRYTTEANVTYKRRFYKIFLK